MDAEFIFSLIHFLGLLLLIASFGIIASPQLAACIRFYAVHAFLLALITGLVGYLNHIPHLVALALLTLLLKTVVIPQVFFWIIRRLGIRKEVESYINIPFSLILAVLLVFLSFYVTEKMRLTSIASREFVPLAVATLLFGMLVMTSRKKALTQVLGLLLMENGLFLMAVTLTFGMPLLVELGIFFDVLVGAVIMGILVFKIRGAFEGIDVDQMTVLKG
ncbi:MAG: formate hydrogenlyase [Candidatus Omnitrophica bacterium]|nr:formate hydrogenlyase [Candidatus Omnitrophota bacterium]